MGNARLLLPLVAATLLQLSIAGYVLTDDYSKDAFFGNFTAFTGGDPTQGFVQYTNYQDATTKGLIGSVANYDKASYVGVDYVTKTTTGRASVRLTSQKSFNHGLFIADIAHMPGGLCGVWPAFWLVGPSWPINGEIDILEGVNAQQANQMTLHTNAGCTINKSGFSGVVNTTSCDGNAADQPKNAGCAIESQDDATYGTGFNAAGGGVYATEWNSSAISTWFFPRSKIPSDISSNNPSPSNWGMPVAMFAGACDIDAHFKDMQIVFDTTFCGVWASKSWGQQAECKAMAPTCESHVGQMTGYFKDAYWLVNSVKVFEES